MHHIAVGDASFDKRAISLARKGKFRWRSVLNGTAPNSRPFFIVNASGSQSFKCYGEYSAVKINDIHVAVGITVIAISVIKVDHFRLVYVSIIQQIKMSRLHF